MSRDEEIEKLQNQIIGLKLKIATLENRPTCPKCGGGVNKSTKFERWYCNQDYGHCGYWVLHEVYKRNRVGNWPQTYFHRTDYDDTGRVGTPESTIKKFRVIYFIGGHEVSEDFYMSTVALDEHDEAWKELANS